MSYTPQQIHALDQRYAQVEHQLDQLIEVAAPALGEDRVERLDFATKLLADPALHDGRTLSPDDHIDLLAGLLSVSIDRLAAHR